MRASVKESSPSPAEAAKGKRVACGLLIALLALLPLLANPASALESTAVRTPQVTASLVSDTDHLEAGRPFRVGLSLDLAPGWHVYWRNPGESGLPTSFTLSLPADARAGAVAWPAPERLTEQALTVYAYTGRVLLPVTVTPGPARVAVPLRAEAHWLVCKDVCIPQEGRFSLDLPPGPPSPSAEAPLFTAADRSIPRPAPWTARIAPDGTLSLQGGELGPATVAEARFFPDRQNVIRDGAAQPLVRAPGAIGLRLALAPGFDPAQGVSGVLILRDKSGQRSAVEVRASPGPVPPALAAVSPPLWRLWALAFAGGVVLNLMPCVFPVLAMKLLALSRGGARAEAWSYAAGVLASFAALGGGLSIARGALGEGIGWGYQFTSPAFVAVIAWVMLGVGLNLLGVFRIGVGRLAGAGQGLATRGGHLGSFATGALAVVVASPCTAPFMAGAVAGALAAPAAATLSVFLAMGLGLAAPYVLLARLPGTARLLPRPGAWMTWLRRALALPMFATAGWLMWVLAQEAGRPGLIAGASGLALIGCAAVLAGLTQDACPARRRLGSGLAAAAVLAGLVLLPSAAPAPADATKPAVGERFTPARLAELRSAGRPVFVDATAAWCLTCLVNERVALDAPQVRRAFRKNGIALLVADWTRQDAAVSAFLRENGRDGVPLYLFYAPGAAQPLALPQVLTPGIVLAAVGG